MLLKFLVCIFKVLRRFYWFILWCFLSRNFRRMFKWLNFVFLWRLTFSSIMRLRSVSFAWRRSAFSIFSLLFARWSLGLWFRSCMMFLNFLTCFCNCMSNISNSFNCSSVIYLIIDYHFWNVISYISNIR